MKKHQFYATVFISFILFTASLEVGLRLWAYFLNRGANEIVANSYRVLALGESTTAKISNGGSSWPEKLENLAEKAGIKMQIFNEAVPATNSTRLVERTPQLIDKYRPHLIISMMGINDLQTIWPKEYLLSKQTIFFQSKLFKLIYYFYLQSSRPYFNRNDHGRYDWPPSDLGIDTNHYLKRLFHQKFESAPYQQTLLEIKETLNDKSHKEQAQFLAYLAFELEKKILKQSDEIRKIAELMYLAAEKDTGVSDSGGLALAYAVATKSYHLCKNIVKFSKRDHHYMGEAYLKNVALCLKDEPDLINDIFKWAGDKYEYRADAEKSPLLYNFSHLKKMTISSKACLLILGYPNRQILPELKNLTFGSETTIFILDQKKNFETALRRYKFHELFNDNFAFDFGHATDLGNSLIAAQVLDFILDIKEKKLCHFDD